MLNQTEEYQHKTHRVNQTPRHHRVHNGPCASNGALPKSLVSPLCCAMLCGSWPGSQALSVQNPNSPLTSSLLCSGCLHPSWPWVCGQTPDNNQDGRHILPRRLSLTLPCFRHHTHLYDEYGFSLHPIYGFDENLESAARNLQRISDELACKTQVILSAGHIGVTWKYICRLSSNLF